MQRGAEESFDLILMDGRMPVMDGLAAARAIRAGGIGETRVLDPGIRMIASTANATGNDRELWLAAGRDDFLSKPVDERLLAQALHRAVDALRARGRPPAPLLDKMALAGGSQAALDPTLPDDEPDVASVDAARTASADAAAGTPATAAPMPSVRALSERLADAFRNETPRLLAELADAVGQRDLARAARIAHNIKGSAYYIDSAQMAEDAGGLEESCDGGDDAGVARHWAALKASIDGWMTAH